MRFCLFTLLILFHNVLTLLTPLHSKEPIDYLILGALSEELSDIHDQMQSTSKNEWAGMKFHKGQLLGKNVVIGPTGIGKSMSAMITQKAIDTFKPQAIIFNGLAGGLHKNLEIGDVVVATELAQHDFDCSAFGFPKGMIPRVNIRFIASDLEMQKRLKNLRPRKFHIHFGRILTGDQFISREQLKDAKHLVDDFNGMAVEMEGASVALVAKMNRIPFIVIRTISDKADGEALHDFKAFLSQASQNSWIVIQHLLTKQAQPI